MKTATCLLCSSDSSIMNFNPCSHEDCNLFLKSMRWKFNQYFNPCSHEDCNKLRLFQTLCNTAFQSMQSWRLQRWYKNDQGIPWVRISIHAVMKTATIKTTKEYRELEFQSMQSWRLQLRDCRAIKNTPVISIHAVMKTATRVGVTTMTNKEFQSMQSWRLQPN